MEDPDIRRNNLNEEPDDDRRRKKGAWWLWLLIPLLLIPLLAYYLMNHDEKNDTANHSQSVNQSSQTDKQNTNGATASLAEIERKYNAEFNTDAKAVYFTPDTAEFQDQAASSAKLDAIAAFVKANPSTKLQSNGSIFADDQVDSNSALAKQRAELVKKLLVERGVSADAVTVSTINKYEGQDDAARAAYARSVTVTVAK